MKINGGVEKIIKKRFLLTLILTFLFLSANVFGIELNHLFGKENKYNIVYAASGARSRASSSGLKSGSFKSSNSSPKSSSGGTKSGSFSNSSPKSGSSTGSSSSSSTKSSSNNNYSPRSSIIPIFIPWFSSGSFFGTSFLGGVTHSVGTIFSGIFKFIIIVIIIIILFNLFKRSRK